MWRWRFLVGALLGASCWLAACSSGSSAACVNDPECLTIDGPLADAGQPPGPGPDGASPGATQGELAVLTYNVAGLPSLISGSKPDVNSPLISPLLNAYDLVLLQEDFNYHDALMSAVTLPYKTEPGPRGATDFGDGLSLLSRSAFSGLQRVPWEACSGTLLGKNDCLTPKGFALIELELTPGVIVDCYDLHADAGRSGGDAAARQKQAEQLVAFIASRPADRAVIVAGDTNMGASDEAQLQTLLGAGLVDACRTLGCPDPNRYDRVLFRSGAQVQLTATEWRNDRAIFVDPSGDPLSDHDPIVVRIDWATP